MLLQTINMVLQPRKCTIAAAATIIALQTKHARAMVSLSHGRGRPSARHDWMTPPPSDPQQILADNQYFERQVDNIVDWWSDKKNVLALTGAGLSTESGIPDYRGHNGSYHYGHKPMIHTQFMTSEKHRKRYWGRAMVGWRSMQTKRPNQGHWALAELERLGRLGVSLPHMLAQQHEEIDPSLSLVTQNVDSLHHRAGSKNVIELHGCINRVRCMTCGVASDRDVFQRRLVSLNAEWLEHATIQDHAQEAGNAMRPDGDSDVTLDFEPLVIPSCERCNDGFIKPDVVFFGDSVPASRVQLVSAAVEACDGVLVVGSSLAVHSAFRHVRAATQKGTPVAILNVGQTRAETEGLGGILKVESPAGPTLAKLVARLSSIS